ncbi:SET domain-containing protein-lysine N-methyltransferase [Kitasatospora sp. NPDC089509]|uniref:SET domain-containing protein-lysine N-methyltransferase n=1 Tax=Kitasatospora sp. NPDC089509 TaxID=3364079 RepID=UPI00382DD40C
MGVLRTQGEYALIACTPIAAGTLIFTIEGTLTDTPSRHSVQVGRHVHVDVSDDVGQEQLLDAYPWRFMNHSCEPSARIEGRRVFAMTDILRGQEVTFHYNTTEAVMASPFDCSCGSGSCEGRIAGFTTAAPTHRKRLLLRLAEHLALAYPAVAADFEDIADPDMTRQ